MTFTPRAPAAPHLSWAIFTLGSIGGSGGWFYDLLTKAGVSHSLAHTLVEFVLRPLEVVLVVAIAWIVGRLGGRLVRRAVTKMGTPASRHHPTTHTLARVQTTAAVAANVWRVVVAVFTVAIVLGMLGIDLTPLLASATIIGATLGFGAQMAVRDFLSGFLLTVEDQFGIGDTIAVNTVTGTVEDVSLRVTSVRTADGSLVYVPNGDIRLLANTSRGWAKAMVDLDVTIGSSGDLTRAIDVVSKAAAEVAKEAPAAAGCTQPPEVLGLVAQQANVGTLRVLLRTNHSSRVAIERSLRAALSGALADAGLLAPSVPGPDPGAAG